MSLAFSVAGVEGRSNECARKARESLAHYGETVGAKSGARVSKTIGIAYGNSQQMVFTLIRNVWLHFGICISAPGGSETPGAIGRLPRERERRKVAHA